MFGNISRRMGRGSTSSLIGASPCFATGPRSLPPIARKQARNGASRGPRWRPGIRAQCPHQDEPRQTRIPGVGHVSQSSAELRICCVTVHGARRDKRSPRLSPIRVNRAVVSSLPLRKSEGERSKNVHREAPVAKRWSSSPPLRFKRSGILKLTHCLRQLLRRGPFKPTAAGSARAHSFQQHGQFALVSSNSLCIRSENQVLNLLVTSVLSSSAVASARPAACR